MIGKIISTAFQLEIMAHADDIMHGRGPSNEMCHQLQLKKTKVILY